MFSVDKLPFMGSTASVEELSGNLSWTIEGLGKGLRLCLGTAALVCLQHHQTMGYQGSVITMMMAKAVSIKDHQ